MDQKLTDTLFRIIVNMYSRIVILESEFSSVQDLFFKFIAEKYPELEDEFVEFFNENTNKLASEKGSSNIFFELSAEEQLEALLKSVNGIKGPNDPHNP
jgi:hypothetical protein